MPPLMPILDDRTVEFLSHSPEQTRRVGVRLGELLNGGHLVCLEGDLGSGKTTLTQGIARGWGALDSVTSPTFVLVNEYQRADAEVLYHVDAFRLATAGEARAMGLAELFAQGRVVVVEWPAHIEAIVPPDHLRVGMRWVDDSRRSLQFQAGGVIHLRLLGEFRKAAFGG
ncbi:MAG TPA: tRNA (adenosine(37)-N6)-threonylcarbamoyltransferase complex ATPase subunit type 1 TsaE [Anaerolineales bacterium]|nr:tRNA (adenosine(37)-N6)-threonylcarbamoyltransferase complex ATPase subunit type 1 TsaE [Anaerolineales bacterium]